MKKNKLASFLIIGMCVTALTGCNKTEEGVVAEAVIETEERNMFGLTESEQKICAEYAAGVLMKYNAGSNMRVLEGQKLIRQEEKEQIAKEREEKRAQAAAEYEASKKEEKKENQSSGSNSTSSSDGAGAGVSYISDMASATGMDSFSITFDGYEVTDSYPNSGEDVFLAMDATQGNVFLVTKYRVTNIGGQTENFNMFSKQAKFRINLDGQRYKSQYTLLLDDLSMYKGDIGAGETIDTVLIFEVPEEATSNINDMVLSITVGNEVNSMQLKGGSSVMWTETAEEIDVDFEQEDSTVGDFDTNQNDESEAIENGEYNDLAEEYLDAIEAENAGMSYEEYYNGLNEGGNVTVVGSNRNQ